MSQKASKYVSTGLRESRHAMRINHESTLKYKVFSLSCLLGKRFFLSYPLFALADYHLAGQIEETRTMDMEKVFEDSSDTAKFRSVAQFALLSQVIFLTGLAVIAAFAYGFIHLGGLMDQFLDFDRNYMVRLFQILGGCVFIAFLIKKATYFGPVIYLIQSGEAVGLSQALSRSASFMTSSGKAKLTYIHIYHLGRFLAYAITAFLVAYGAFLVLPTFSFIAIALVAGILVIRSLPRIMLSHKISSMQLFSDLITENAYESLLDKENTEGTNTRISKEKTLLDLFDELSDDEDTDESDTRRLAHERG